MGMILFTSPGIRSIFAQNTADSKQPAWMHVRQNMTTEIVAATGNSHKIDEIRSILCPSGIAILTPGDVGGIPETVEDGDSFEANAAKKATHVARRTGRLSLADDSGLEVKALDGAPGIYSSRYAGEEATDRMNTEKLLEALSGVDDRRARFVCVVVLASPSGIVGSSFGEIRGTIACTPRGVNGFGYDPVFVPDGYRQSFAQLPARIKNQLSHRAVALRSALRDGLFRVNGGL